MEVRMRVEWDRVEPGWDPGTRDLVFPTPADAREAARLLYAAADKAEIAEEGAG